MHFSVREIKLPNTLLLLSYWKYDRDLGRVLLKVDDFRLEIFFPAFSPAVRGFPPPES